MNVAGAGAIAASIGIPLVLALLRFVFPASNTIAAASGQSFEQLRAKYAKWETRAGLICGVSIILLGVLIWLLLKTVGHWYADNFLPHGDFSVPMPPYYWGFPALFLAVLAGFPIYRFVVIHALKERYSEFLAYESLRTGYNMTRANRAAILFATVLSAFLIFAGLRTYVILSGHEFITNGFISSEARRDLSTDVQKIETAPQFIASNGDKVTRREYIVFFKDRTVWTTDGLPAMLTAKQKRDFMDLIAKQSGLPIQEIPAFDKGLL